MELKYLTTLQLSTVVPTILCLYVCYTLVSLLYTQYVVPYRLIKKTGLNYPVPIPFIGNGLEHKITERHIGQIKRREKYGKVHATLFFTIPVIWIGDPELLKEVLIKDFSNFSNRFSAVDFGQPFEKTLLQLKDGEWKRVRNVMVPTFSALKLKSIMPFINKSSDILVKRLLKAGEEGTAIDMWRTCGKFTMQVIFATAFGIEFESEEQEQKFTDAAGAIFSGVPKFLQLLILLSFSLFSRIEPLVGGKFMSSMKFLMQTINDVMRERRRNIKQGISCRKDILQQMIEAGDKDRLSDDEIVSQAFIFLIAGYETTANTVAFASYFLATNPDVQQKLIEEIYLKCPDASSIDYDTVHNLPYLDMVICETLRIYPSAFFVNRAVKKDTTIKGVHFPKGVMVGLPIYGLHHDPDLWPNPEQFNPERFTPDEKAKHHACSYLPFGSGPRNCIGMRLALLEVKVALIKALQNVELIAVRETEVPLQIRGAGSLQPVNGIYVGIRKRH